MSVDTQPSSTVKQVRFTDSWASSLFDLIRGLAALVVFFEHARNLFFVDYPQLASHRLLLAIPYLVTGAGHQAVVVFFVLSGFFIGGAVFRSVERGHWSWADYLTRRFVRLWVVLIPALLLCCFWDRLGIYLDRAPDLYSGIVPNHIISFDVRQRLSPSIFFGNLFFVHTILVPVFGSDGPLWSLVYEFWYYILFPLGLFTIRPGTPRSQRFFFAVLFLTGSGFVRGGILNYFPIWLSGTLLLLVPPLRLSPSLARRIRVLASIVYAVTFFLLSRMRFFSGLWSDYILAVITFGFLWVLLSASHRTEPRSSRVVACRGLARFSYTLYAVHSPVLVFCVALILGNTRWVPTPLHVLSALGIWAIVLAYAYGLASLTEFRTGAIRTRLEGLFRLPAIPEVSPIPILEPENSRQNSHFRDMEQKDSSAVVRKYRR
jgi:peptidoglycan/LPS O-acetylase OafA/YrhL